MNADRLQVSEVEIKEGYRLTNFTLKTYFPFHSNYEKTHGLTHDDLLQIGIVGWWKALQDYDESKGEFSTVVIPYIRNEITKHVILSYNSFKVSKEIVATASYFRKHGINDETRKGAKKKFKISKDVLERAINFSKFNMMSGEQVIEGTENITLFDAIADETARHVLEKAELTAKLDERLSILTETERTCLSMRIKGYMPSDIAEVIGETGQKVCAYIRFAMRKIDRTFNEGIVV